MVREQNQLANDQEERVLNQQNLKVGPQKCGFLYTDTAESMKNVGWSQQQQQQQQWVGRCLVDRAPSGSREGGNKRKQKDVEGGSPKSGGSIGIPRKTIGPVVFTDGGCSFIFLGYIILE